MTESRKRRIPACTVARPLSLTMTSTVSAGMGSEESGRERLPRQRRALGGGFEGGQELAQGQAQHPLWRVPLPDQEVDGLDQ